MQQLTLVYRDPRELNPYINNPRINEPALPKLKADIQEFGFVSPVLIAGDEIVDGHARHKVALEMELEEIPTVDVSHLSPDQVSALRIVMNKSAEWAQWDDEKLLEELRAIEMDMERFGVDIEALAASLEFSGANKELSFDTQESFTIRLVYSEEEYTRLKEQMEKLDILPEQLFLNAVMSHVPV